MNNKNYPQLASAYLQELAADIMLELTSEEIASILDVEGSLRQKFAKVTKIKTDNVEPLNYPFEEPHTYLRDDKLIEVVDQAVVLANAPTIAEDFVTVVKVVK